MKARIQYSGKTYGNGENAPGYAVRILRDQSRRTIYVDFDLDSPADGRGAGIFQGSVESVRLTLPPEACRALAHGLEVALADVTKGTVDFRIDERPSE